MPVDFCGSLFETNRHASYMLVVGAHLYVSSFFLFLLLLSPRVIHKCPPVCQFASFCAPLPSLFFFFLISCRFCLNSYLVSVLYIGNMAGGSVCHCEFWNSCGSNSALLGKHTILSVTKRNQWECVLCKCLGGRGETTCETGSARRCLQCHSRPHS